jgi:hypothetical protein
VHLRVTLVQSAVIFGAGCCAKNWLDTPNTPQSSAIGSSQGFGKALTDVGALWIRRPRERLALRRLPRSVSGYFWHPRA